MSPGLVLPRSSTARAPERKFLLRFANGLAPGDYVVTTALLRDLQVAYGGKYQAYFDSSFSPIYAHNPNVTVLKPRDPDVEVVTLCYRSEMEASRSGARRHFVRSLHIDFLQKTGIDVPLTLPRPDIYLSDYERETSPIAGRYWLLLAGGKSDFTVKHWDFARYQQLVDALTPHGIQIAQSGSTAPGHIHPLLSRVHNLVGWGYLRELIWQIYHAEGVICPITAAMHIAAALEKPAVVIAGGREEPWWEAYDNNWNQFGPAAPPVSVPHVFLHTLDKLPCCTGRGCWTNKIVATDKDKNACKQLAARAAGVAPLPECMNRITVEQVADGVLSYYRDGTLPPISRLTPPLQMLVTTVPWQPLATTVVDKPFVERYGSHFRTAKTGTRLTVCLDGCDYTPAALNRCLSRLEATAPRLRRDIRILLPGDVDDSIKKYAKSIGSLVETANLSDPHARRAALLSGSTCNITTRYLVWFSNGAWPVCEDWMNLLADCIERQPYNVGMFANRSPSRLAPSEIAELRSHAASANWWQCRKFAITNEIPTCDTWFFAVATNVIRQCDVTTVPPKCIPYGAYLALQLAAINYKLAKFNLGDAIISRTTT